MVHLARRWGALTELEESVRSGVISSGGNNVGDIIHSLPDGVAVTDERGTLLEANATFAAMCGMPVRESLAGRPLSEISPTLTSELANCDVADAKRVSFEFAAGGSDTLRTLRCTRSPQLLNGRPATGHVWVLRDITQQRLADSTRDSFLAAATHELRTPLANISAYAESLATTEGELDHESQKSFYNVIQSEAMRLSQLIDDLLDISHMQAGALAIDRRETDLQRVVTEVIHKVEATMESRNIEFECDLPPKYPKLAIDKSKITAALVNLLGNAAKYTPEGGRVTFRMDVKPTAVEFSVADTGIGIAPEEVDRVFERFFRSDDERVRDIPGSGLGLAITREIVRLHGGDLTADSELNVGSVFRMTLPIEEVGGLDVPA